MSWTISQWFDTQYLMTMIQVIYSHTRKDQAYQMTNGHDFSRLLIDCCSINLVTNQTRTLYSHLTEQWILKSIFRLRRPIVQVWTFEQCPSSNLCQERNRTTVPIWTRILEWSRNVNTCSISCSSMFDHKQETSMTNKC